MPRETVDPVATGYSVAQQPIARDPRYLVMKVAVVQLPEALYKGRAAAEKCEHSRSRVQPTCGVPVACAWLIFSCGALPRVLFLSPSPRPTPSPRRRLAPPSVETPISWTSRPIWRRSERCECERLVSHPFLDACALPLLE